MFSEIILNITPFEKRMALMEDHQLVELFVEREHSGSFAGNIYKGIVKDVVPGLGAAFVDIGLSRTAFLHHSDFVETLDDEVDDDSEQYTSSSHSKKGASNKIADLVKSGDEVLVQVQKGPIGSKGARLIGQISIPGKFLVFFPNQEKIAISRKIGSSAEKNRIKSILQSCKKPGIGLIVRTEAEGYSEEDFVDEYTMLQKSWDFLERKIKSSPAPCCIFDENDIVSTIVRDIFSSKIDRLVVDDEDFYKQIVARLKEYNEEMSEKCEWYREETPLFDAYNIEKEIQKIFNTRIYLPSGGNIVIEPTEALTAVDVNTGSFTKAGHYHDTIKKTNLEAAREIARQIRLRNLSGIMIVDFIDMSDDSSRQSVLDVLKQACKRDRAKNKVYNFSPLGLVEITRKRTRSTLLQTYFEHCPYCRAPGRTLSKDAVLFQINRWLQRCEYLISEKRLDIYIHPTVKNNIDKKKHVFHKTSNIITVHEDATLMQDNFKIILVDEKKDITDKFSP
jgi:ribonuclease G